MGVFGFDNYNVVLLWIDQSALAQDDRNNEAVQSNSLAKDEHQNHPYEDLRLLSVGSHSWIPNVANSVACCKTTQSTSESWCEEFEADVQGHIFIH